MSRRGAWNEYINKTRRRKKRERNLERQRKPNTRYTCSKKRGGGGGGERTHQTIPPSAFSFFHICCFSSITCPPGPDCTGNTPKWPFATCVGGPPYWAGYEVDCCRECWPPCPEPRESSPSVLMIISNRSLYIMIRWSYSIPGLSPAHA